MCFKKIEEKNTRCIFFSTLAFLCEIARQQKAQMAKPSTQLQIMTLGIYTKKHHHHSSRQTFNMMMTMFATFLSAFLLHTYWSFGEQRNVAPTLIKRQYCQIIKRPLLPITPPGFLCLLLSLSQSRGSSHLLWLKITDDYVHTPGSPCHKNNFNCHNTM